MIIGARGTRFVAFVLVLCLLRYRCQIAALQDVSIALVCRSPKSSHPRHDGWSIDVSFRIHWCPILTPAEASHFHNRSVRLPSSKDALTRKKQLRSPFTLAKHRWRFTAFSYSIVILSKRCMVTAAAPFCRFDSIDICPIRQMW